MAKTKTRKRAPVKAARSSTTALVRAPKRAPARQPRTQRYDVVEPDDRLIAGEDILLGELGFVELKLTPAEEAVLSKQVNSYEIKIKPNGAAYLPHPVYTRWFNDAFGRLAWALVPVGKPRSTPAGKRITVVTPYVLHVHGKPVAFAWGEQDYYESNADQTYGDALESTVASAMRRVAKRMGVGLEMWDRDYLEVWRDERCVLVKCEPKKGETKAQWLWRLKGAKPFWNEVKKGSSRRRDEEPVDDRPGPPDYLEEEPAGTKNVGRGRTVPAEDRATHAAEGEKITLQQRQRIAMIVNSSDRSDEEVARWLRSSYGITGEKPTRDILRKDYEAICKALEAPGALKGRA